MAKRVAYMIQETLHGTWFREEQLDGENWVSQNEGTIWIGEENKDVVSDTRINIMMGLNGYAKNPPVKVVTYDYVPPTPEEFA